MVIRALSQPAIRAIGAGQALVDPVAVIKELIDNALDAHATSINIQSSANTVDLIQVRDNGHGIAPADRALVAKRYCTSKIISEDDIRLIGGSSLGFRGEALASAAELSGSLTITTRVEGEQAAVMLVVNQQGEITKTNHSSLSIGTIVQVTDFLAAHPVRKQATQKFPEKYIKAIRHMLQSYAFARPSVRFSFQVINNSSTRHNFVYAPNANNDVRDTASKLLGAVCIGQCTWSHVTERGFRLQALVPRLTAEPHKISGFGSYISIDARPLSSAREVAKTITKSFREVLKRTHGAFSCISDPFLYLEISCPPGSYDVNVEPTKDDVLFEDPGLVFQISKEMFQNFYGLEQNKLTRTDERFESPFGGICSGAHSKIVSVPYAQGLPGAWDGQTLLNIGQNSVATISTDQADFAPSQDSPKGLSFFDVNMFGRDADEILPLGVHSSASGQGGGREELREADVDIKLSNPWVLAKLNAAHPPGRQGGGKAPDTATSTQTDLPTSFVDPARTIPVSSSRSVPGTCPSSSTLHLESLSHSESSASCSEEGRSVREKGYVLWQRPVSIPITGPYRAPAEDVFAASNAIEELMSSPSTLPVMSMPADTPLTQIPDVSSRHRPRPRPKLWPSGLSKPSIVPSRHPPRKEKVWFDHLESPCPTQSGPRSKRQRLQQDSTGLVTSGEDSRADKSQGQLPTHHCRDIRAFASMTSPEKSHLLQIPEQPHGSRGDSHGVVARPDLSADVACSVHERSVDSHEPVFAGLSYARESNKKTPKEQPMQRRHSHRRSGQMLPVARSDTDPSPASFNQDNGVERSHNVHDAVFDRRGAVTMKRTKSAQLALEQIPIEQRIHNVIQSVTLTVSEIASSTAESVVKHSVPEFGDPITESHDPSIGTDLDLREVAGKLHVFLTDAAPDLQIVDADDILEMLREAFHVQPMARNEHDEMLDV